MTNKPLLNISGLSSSHASEWLLDTIRQGEGSGIEFKSSFQKEVIEALAAFANTKGGAVLVGVSDEGQIVGVTIQAETIQGWINQCKQNTSPSVIPDIEIIEIDNCRGQHQRIPHQARGVQGALFQAYRQCQSPDDCHRNI